MDKLFNKETPFYLFIENIKRRSACSDGVEWTELEKHKDKPFGMAMSDFLSDDNADEAWAIWCLTLYYNFWEEDLRIDCMRKIKDEMNAFNLYIDLENLTDKEEEILKSKFEGKLPIAEKELLDGIIKRNKK